MNTEENMGDRITICCTGAPKAAPCEQFVRQNGRYMNRKYLLDSLDGLKAIIFRLLPTGITQQIACVPMTTDGPWTNAERAVFEAAIGIPNERTLLDPR